MKLWIHQRSFSEESLIINPKEFPGIKVGDIVEIFHPDENNSHLLLQVKTLQDGELPQKDIISVDQTIANLFHLRAYKDALVRPVNVTQNVALDLVELVFKDQYISRSDMWRLKKNLVHSCLHIQQKIEHCGIRAQVNELWTGGSKVMCGAVTEDTRVAFRSSTAMVYMLIQMSAEMWDFNTCGDLYIEKAVDGFLTELFNQWKHRNINSELTLVLFSRTFYEAKSLDEFPTSFCSALHVDCKDRIYQDFYRVVVHNERRDDWMPMLSSLKKIMWEYNQTVSSNSQSGLLPKCYNSTAADGNLLEAINMSLNVFDNHYINRNFDRTGQVVEVISPGAAVFHVDRTLCDITKHRMIDYGIGSDLVCLAEQPPHPVPLLLFTDERALRCGSTDTHHIPYWLNYSFYLSPSQRKQNVFSAKSHFIPRIRMPARKSHNATSTNCLPKLPHNSTNGMSQTVSCDSETANEADEFARYDQAIFKVHNAESNKSNNPFAPTSLSTKLTPDRRRWTHTFPHGPHGAVIQLHHRPSSQSLLEPNGTSGSELSCSSSTSSLSIEPAAEETTLSESPSRLRSQMVNLKRRIGCGWGITGEQAWTPFLQTGVDWKSLTATACFPLTTDFYPDNKTLETDYQESPQTLDVMPEEDREATSGKTIQSVFEELIAQRIIQNFQLVALPKPEITSLAHKGSCHLPLVTNPARHEYVLSYSEMYHKITLKPDVGVIEVVRYNARKQRTRPKLGYSYQLWAVHHSGYEVTHTRVYHKPVDNMWNHRDNYICLGGAAPREGFDLKESLKFWCSRFILLPSASTLVRRLTDQSYQGRLDVFEERSPAQRLSLIEGFLRFVEGLNRRRKVGGRAQSQRPSIVADATTPRRLPSRGSGDNTPTLTPQPTLTLSTATITSALAGISITGGGGRGREDGVISVKNSPSSPEREKLCLLSSLSYITAVMKDPIHGVSFVTGGDGRGLPFSCFVAAEGVAWVQRNFIGSVTHREAMLLMQVMLDDGYIRAIFSSAANATFFYGYYIYCLDVVNPDLLKGSPLPFDLGTCSQWFEVACPHPDDDRDRSLEAPETETVPGKQTNGVNGHSTSVILPAYRSLFLEVDSKLSDRVQWCHAAHHCNYIPERGFEIELQWLTSTPSLLHELCTNWARRALTCGFHLVLNHNDPFGFNTDTADPSHSPLFIELRLPAGYLDEAGDEGRMKEGRTIQRQILARFGFLGNHTSCRSPLAINTESGRDSLPLHSQYVHTTGSAYMLLLPLAQSLPTTPRVAENLPCLCKLGSSEGGTPIDGSPNHRRGGRDSCSDVFKRYGDRLGFLYADNYLLTRKWRSAATGDDKFHDALLTDFCRFCHGEDTRLGELLATVRCGEVVDKTG